MPSFAALTATWLLVLVVLAIPASTKAGEFACPSCNRTCHCQCNNASKFVSCAAQNLSRIPEDLPSDVRELDLSNNLIADLSGLNNLTSLTRLKLSHNRISEWKPDWLTGLESLEQLTLSQNLLKNPPPTLCSRLPGLTHLFLDSNQLTGNFSADYMHCTSLSRLTLSNNPYRTIDNETLCNLAGHTDGKKTPRLLSLKLNRLQLESAQSGSLACLSHRLISLDLGQNSLNQSSLEGLIGGSCLPRLQSLNLRRSAELQAVSSGLLNCSTALHALMLDASPMVTQLHTEAFALTPKLRILSLNKTSISGWKDDCLGQLKELKSLDLSFSPISTVGGRNGSDANALHQLVDSDKFNNLNLANASLQCNCSLYWLWQRLRDSPQVNKKITGGIDSLTCAGPPELRGVRLAQFNGMAACDGGGGNDGFFTRKLVIILIASGAGALVLFVAIGVAVALLRRRRARSGDDAETRQQQQQQQPPPPQLAFSGASSAASSVENLHEPLVPPDADRRGGRGRGQESIWIRLRRLLRDRRAATSTAGGGGVGRPPIFDPRRPPEDYLNADEECA